MTFPVNPDASLNQNDETNDLETTEFWHLCNIFGIQDINVVPSKDAKDKIVINHTAQ